MSTRLSRGSAHVQALKLRAALERLDALLSTELTGHASNPRALSVRESRRRLAGYRHELAALRTHADTLVAGLAGVGPTRDGKLGGQRQGGLATSAAACELVKPRAGTQRDLILSAVVERIGLDTRSSFAVRHGCTDVELQQLTALAANSVRPRRVELVDAGWLCDSTHRRQHNGRDHVVWTLTPTALQKLGLTNQESTP